MKKRGVKKSKPLTLKQKKFLAAAGKFVAKTHVSFYVFGKKVTWVVTGDTNVLDRPFLMNMTVPAISKGTRFIYPTHWGDKIADTRAFSKKAYDVDLGEIVLVPTGNHDDKYYAAERIE